MSNSVTKTCLADFWKYTMEYVERSTQQRWVNWISDGAARVQATVCLRVGNLVVEFAYRNKQQRLRIGGEIMSGKCG